MFRRRLATGLAVGLVVIVPACLALMQTVWPTADVIGATRHLQTLVLLVAAPVIIWAFWEHLLALRWVVLTSLSGLLIATELGLVFFLVYGGFAELGMPGLFWADAARVQFAAALGVTLFVLWMLYLLFVRDFEVHRHEPAQNVWGRFRRRWPSDGRAGPWFTPTHEDTSGVSQLRWFLAGTGLPALAALAVPALLPAYRPWYKTAIVAWPWLAGELAGAVIVALLVIGRAATRLHEAWRQVVRLQFDSKRVIALDPGRVDPRANVKNIIVIVAVVYALSYADQSAGHRYMRALSPPAFSLCVMLGVVSTFVTWLGTSRPRTQFAIVGVLALAVAVAGLLDYEVELRDLYDRYPSAYDQSRRQVLRGFGKEESVPRGYSHVQNLTPYQKSADRPIAGIDGDPAKQRERWLVRWRDSFKVATGSSTQPHKPILVIVCTSGGALRAAVWTEVVLGYLDCVLDDFPHHVRLITGASGGMLGAARFVEYQHSGRMMPVSPRGGPCTPRASLPPPDYLGAIAWQIAFRDAVPNSIVPSACYNRGDALEDELLRSGSGIGDHFEDHREGEEAGRIASIIFSPMMVEDGRRLLISNLPLADLTHNSGRALLREDVKELKRRIARNYPDEPTGDDYDLEYPGLASVQAVEFFRLFGDGARKSLRLVSAVRMSATFPYVTSAVVLPTDPPRHVVDAGYYDNYGVNLAAGWVASHIDWLRANTGGVLVVQIRAFQNEKRLKCLNQEIAAPAPADAGPSARLAWLTRPLPMLWSSLTQGMKGWIIPVQGVARARDSSMYFRNDEQLLVLREVFHDLTGQDDFFRTVVFTCSSDQVGQEAQNLETLNWYMDREEYDDIRANMGYDNPKENVGRDRNDLRVLSLIDWWKARGGKVRTPPPRAP